MKLVKSALLGVAMLLIMQAAASAQDQAQVEYAKSVKGTLSDTRAIGIGLIIIGAGLGIGGLAKSAVESMARQPEVATNIQGAMVLAAALIEGATFFALIIVMLFIKPY